MKKVITTEMFNVYFHNKFIKFWSILFFQLFFIYMIRDASTEGVVGVQLKYIWKNLEKSF